MSKRISLTIVMGLLLCALPTLEVPEFLSLTDNTSNDYSAPVFQGNGCSAAQNLAPCVAQDTVFTNPPVEFAEPAAQPEPFGSVDLSSDLLHLLCVQRT